MQYSTHTRLIPYSLNLDFHNTFHNTTKSQTDAISKYKT